LTIKEIQDLVDFIGEDKDDQQYVSIFQQFGGDKMNVRPMYLINQYMKGMCTLIIFKNFHGMV
jgi:hypothetical protein